MYPAEIAIISVSILNLGFQLSKKIIYRYRKRIIKKLFQEVINEKNYEKFLEIIKQVEAFASKYNKNSLKKFLKHFEIPEDIINNKEKFEEHFKEKIVAVEEVIIDIVKDEIPKVYNITAEELNKIIEMATLKALEAKQKSSIKNKIKNTF